MQTKCEVCGDPFEAKRATARYCGERCKKQAQRRPKKDGPSLTIVTSLEQIRAAAAEVVAGAPPAAADDPPTAGIVVATMQALTRAGTLNTALGQAAMLVAVRLETVGLADTGAGVSALIKAHREALAEATKDATTEESPLEKIRAAAALVRLGGLTA